MENEKLIERLIGQGKAIPGTLTSAIARLEPGTVKVEKFRGAGVADTHLLSRNIVRAFSKSNLNPKLFPDPGSMKWSKLLTNLIANASSAILDIPPESIFAHKGLFVMEREQLRETLRVMKAQGYRPVNLPKTPVKSLVFAVDRLPLHFSQWLLQHAVGKGRGQKMPSFHIDLHSGSQKSEVGYLNGAVVRFGKRLGLDTPVNARLNSILIDLTEGRIPIDTFSHNPEKLLEAVNLARKSP